VRRLLKVSVFVLFVGLVALVCYLNADGGWYFDAYTHRLYYAVFPPVVEVPEPTRPTEGPCENAVHAAKPPSSAAPVAADTNE